MRLCPRICFLLVVFASSVAFSQKDPPEGFPFSVWIEHDEVTQIPWTFSVSRPMLRTDFRQELRIGAGVRSSEELDLVLYARAIESGRVITPIHAASALEQAKLLEPLVVSRPSTTRFHSVYMPVIARPGKYTVEIALLDRVTGRYNTRYENVTVSGNSSDLIERSFAKLSKFEFAGIPKPDVREEAGGIPFEGLIPLRLTRGVPQYSSLGAAAFAVSSASPLFVIDRPRPLKLTIFSILSPPDNALGPGAGSENARFRFQNNLWNLLSALMRFDVVNGSSDLIAMDLGNRSRAFDRIPLKDVHPDALRSAMSKDRTTVSLNEIVGRPDSGKFLRDALTERLQEAAADTSGATHAIIIAGARAKVPGSQTLEPIPAPQDCHCKVFYVRFRLSPSDNDDMPRLISAYRPRTFEPLTWLEFREQFTTIYQQLLQ